MHKSIKVHYVPLTMLVNTGRYAKIFNIHAHNNLGSPALKSYSGMLVAFGNSKIKPLGYFQVPIMIADEEFITNACVVDNVSIYVSKCYSW